MNIEYDMNLMTDHVYKLQMNTTYMEQTIFDIINYTQANLEDVEYFDDYDWIASKQKYKDKDSNVNYYLTFNNSSDFNYFVYELNRVLDDIKKLEISLALEV